MADTIRTVDLAEFEMAEQLRTEEDIAQYITMVLQDGDTDELIRAVGHIAKARGITQIAEKTGLGRTSLYKALKVGSRPQLDTMLKVLKALNIDLQAVRHNAMR